ncbi:RHS repeat-associated core domain-containing protein [Burkholderia stabilis]|uniref:RHS repeat-associated core domain-containing protein n=1 Tax=Burkholderia stabilis TaxID=95485 RepID=UPI00196B7BDB|nr:RHS repeat-associated core domain-containing protein [Burkholderia stabilis]
MKKKQQHDGAVATTLLATDQQRSLLRVRYSATQSDPLSYTPYGYRALGRDLLGFNGEYMDPVTGYYLLGNGYRYFNPVLMYFHSPDSFSPFGKGGLNAYCYVEGDPVNFTDPTGASIFGAIGRLLRITKRVTTSSPAAQKIPAALRMAPVRGGEAVEKTIHKITEKDLSSLYNLAKSVEYGNITLPPGSPWNDMGNIARFAGSNLGRPGITSTSRANIGNLIERGKINVRTTLNELKSRRAKERPVGKRVTNFLGDDRQK